MMRSWAEVVQKTQAELERCSQQLGGGILIPDEILLKLPESVFGPWAPILQQVTGEVGEDLLKWASNRRAQWYSPAGPRLEIRLVKEGEETIETSFSNGSRSQ